MKYIILISLSLIIGCSSFDPTPVCPSGDLDCNGFCYDPNHYACEGGHIILTACYNGYQICRGTCVPFPSDCCGNGTFCYGSLCSSNSTCRPVGSEDCGGGRYCAYGRGYCCNGGTSCC